MIRKLGATLAVVLIGCTSAGNASDANSATYVGCNGDKRINLTGIPADITSEDGALTLHFTAADPAVPLAGENTWTFAVQSTGGVTADIKSVSAAAFMPDHGHPSSVAPIATLLPSGTWLLSNLYLTMAGVWRVTLTLERADGTKATALVYACVAG